MGCLGTEKEKLRCVPGEQDDRWDKQLHNLSSGSEAYSEKYGSVLSPGSGPDGGIYGENGDHPCGEGDKDQLCAQLRVCSQAGGNPVYPRFSQPDNSESWDDVGNGIWQA